MLARTTHPLSDLAASIREGCPAITSSLYTPREWSSAAWAAHDDDDWSDLEHMVAQDNAPGNYCAEDDRADHLYELRCEREMERREIREVVTSFVNAKLNPPRSPEGYARPRIVTVDIETPGVNWVDADVRRVSDAGVEIFFYNKCRLCPWSDVRQITVASRDKDGNRTSSRRYEARPTAHADYQRGIREDLGRGL
jgi:hypothetical protein